MKTAAVICEYNPFHYGHRYMLETMRSSYGIDRIVCFMSGNFVQRGEPAIIDKYRRAEAALLSGADLVLEMPVEFSTASAGDFARCGISMALAAGICTHLCFGVEPGVTPEALEVFRRNVNSDEAIRENLKKGMTYAEALKAGGRSSCPGPNTLLACEYLNALELYDTARSISPVCIERSGDPYHAGTVSGNGFASATAIRKLMLSGRETAGENVPGTISGCLPYDCSREVLCSCDMLSGLLNDRLLRETCLESYQDVSREIADRLAKSKYHPMTYSERVDETKTRQYTRTRISRALLHIVLGIRKDRVDALRLNGYCEYFRVLGYRTDSGLLAEINRSSDIPVFTKNARFYEAFPDVLYYDQIWHNVTGTGTELTRSPVIL